MYRREVHLVELFTGQTVIIAVDGSELARAERTVTDQRKGYARIIRVDLPDTTKSVDVTIAETGARISVAVAPERLRAVKVFLKGGSLVAEIVDEDQYRQNPRGYG